MKIAGCLMLALAGLIIGIGIVITVFSGKEMVESMQEPTEMTGADLTTGTEGRLDSVQCNVNPEAPAMYYAVIDVEVSSTETTTVSVAGGTATRPDFEIPIRMEVIDGDGNQIGVIDDILLPSTSSMDYLEDGTTSGTTGSNRMKIRQFVQIIEQNAYDGNNQNTRTLTVNVKATIQPDTKGVAKIESARLSVVKQEIPVAAAIGMFAGMGIGICLGGAIGLVGLILLIIGLASGKKHG